MNWTAVLALGMIAIVGTGCHSSSHGVVGTGGAGGNAHADAAGDSAGNGAGGGGGTSATTDGGAGARGSGGGGGATTGAGGGAGAIDAASDAYGAGCNTLMLGAPVTVDCAPDGGVPPTPTGGALVPGTYALTAVTDYGSCSPFLVAQTVVLSGNTFQTLIDSPLTGVSRANSTFVIEGTNLNLTQTCPTTDASTLNTFGFSVVTTAGITTMTLTSVLGTTTTVGVFTKQ